MADKVRVRFVRDKMFGGRAYGPRHSEQEVAVEPWQARHLVRRRDAVLVEHRDPVAEQRDPVVSGPVPGTLNHVGGGWWDVVVDGEVVDKVQGRANAEERLAELS